MNKYEYDALHDALASTRMEGFMVTEQTEKDCVRLMRGEVLLNELIEEIMCRTTEKNQNMSNDLAE